MRLLIVTPHFYPENFKVNDIAFEMARRGHEVSVMTAIPDYPDGRFLGSCGVFRKRKETVRGVTVHRSLIVPRHSGTAFWLALNYISYTLFATFKAVWFGLTRKYDAIFVHETSPVMVGIPAVIMKKILGIPLYFWVLDLWPESLSAAGGISSRKILAPFEKLTRWIYRNSDKILIGSKGFKKSICEKGEFADKIMFFPNWVEDVLENGTECTTPEFPDGFNVLFAGNMGDSQDLPHIMEAAITLKGKGINFIFVGDGRKRDWTERFANEHGISDSVKCLGRFPLEAMPSFFKKADLLFFALKDTKIFSLTVPSRLQAYMSSGKPVVAMINGEGREVIEEADCGWSVPAESPVELATLLLRLSKTDKNILESKGANGKAYSMKYYNYNKAMDNLEKLISDNEQY